MDGDQQHAQDLLRALSEVSLLLGLVGGVAGAMAYELARSLCDRWIARRDAPADHQPQR
ncbi:MULTISPECIES: hypothetical protein [Delftia]|uniref:hypothetical protein n=1 Tax=Delftia TaxID=80865 RepID=UPI00187B2C3B|nr:MULTISPECIES: hypothetical protein [Delftia]